MNNHKGNSLYCDDDGVCYCDECEYNRMNVNKNPEYYKSRMIMRELYNKTRKQL